MLSSQTSATIPQVGGHAMTVHLTDAAGCRRLGRWRFRIGGCGLSPRLEHDPIEIARICLRSYSGSMERSRASVARSVCESGVGCDSSCLAGGFVCRFSPRSAGGFAGAHGSQASRLNEVSKFASWRGGSSSRITRRHFSHAAVARRWRSSGVVPVSSS